MDRHLARSTARLVAWGRLGLGISALVAPAAFARPWIGPEADGNGARHLARALAGRDLALGAGALTSSDDLRSWAALGGVADAVDAAVTVGSFRRLPRVTRWFVLASTVGAAGLSLAAAASLGDPGAGLPAGPHGDTGAGSEAGVPGGGHR
jgi:hypothetical protein